MKIVIIGWYGTETIGDRGILAGILKTLIDVYKQCEFSIGSLYPFFTERTVYEDDPFWKILTGSEFDVTIFDSTNAKTLRGEIQKSELVVMGGGPLMHINELYMVEYAFTYTKKLHKKTAILGCGVGPINNNAYRKTIISIINLADLVILRDKESLQQLQYITQQLHSNVDTDIKVSLDPAVIPCLEFIKTFGYSKRAESDRICINLRSFPNDYSLYNRQKIINSRLKHFVEQVCKQNLKKEILLVPMHYFHVGNDDRVFLNRVANEIDANNVTVHNDNLSLFQTLSVFNRAAVNIGMRYHSIVFQTIVSGRNYVLDYTEPRVGKISGFINAVDSNEFYASRYFNIQEVSDFKFTCLDNDDAFILDKSSMLPVLGVYKNGLEELF